MVGRVEDVEVAKKELEAASEHFTLLRAHRHNKTNDNTNIHINNDKNIKCDNHFFDFNNDTCSKSMYRSYNTLKSGNKCDKACNISGSVKDLSNKNDENDSQDIEKNLLRYSQEDCRLENKIVYIDMNMMKHNNLEKRRNEDEYAKSNKEVNEKDRKINDINLNGEVYRDIYNNENFSNDLETNSKNIMENNLNYLKVCNLKAQFCEQIYNVKKKFYYDEKEKKWMKGAV